MDERKDINHNASYSTSEDDCFELDGEAEVHLLVTKIIPPFVDGRIVFTKQIPIKDPTGDMTLVSRGRGAGSFSTTWGSSSSWLTVSLLGTLEEAA